jgi:2-(3-amino-3-carboxypropyl)histidine synthase
LGYFNQTGKNDISIITMGDLTYGACCVDDYLASSMGCDLIVHYAHSCLIPINQLSDKVKYLYVFLDIKFDLDHVISCIKHTFRPEVHKIAVASTIQFVASVHQVARILKQHNYEITLPQSRPLSSAEVLGCTAPKLGEDINTIVFICDGRFHLEALMIANPNISAFRYDPYAKKLTRESYGFDDMYDQRMEAITKAVDVMKNGGTFGFVLGTLGRQGNEAVYDKMIERLERHSSCRCVKVLLPEIIHDTLKAFDSIDVWVQIACPRLSIDWGASFETPLLNPYEFAKSIKILLSSKNNDAPLQSQRDYPMDFYAKCSQYDHTPNHACNNNPHCDCVSLQ